MKKFWDKFLIISEETPIDTERLEKNGLSGVFIKCENLDNTLKQVKRIKFDSNLLIGVILKDDSLLKSIPLEYINFICTEDKSFEVQLSKEVDENYNPVYGLIEI